MVTTISPPGTAAGIKKVINVRKSAMTKRREALMTTEEEEEDRPPAAAAATTTDANKVRFISPYKS